MNIELSIPHSGEVARINSCLSINDVFVIVRNGTDSVNYFYEDWNSYGYYNISFEIKYKDSIYEIRRPRKIWYRNFPSYHILKPNESLVFPHLLIDTSCSNALFHDGIFEDGWLGFPYKPKADTVEIRVIYQLCHPGEVRDEENIGRLNYPEDNYIYYLDENIGGYIKGYIHYEKKSKPVKKVETRKQPVPPKILPDTNRVIIFNEVLVSKWQTVIL